MRRCMHDISRRFCAHFVRMFLICAWVAGEWSKHKVSLTTSWARVGKRRDSALTLWPSSSTIQSNARRPRARVWHSQSHSDLRQLNEQEQEERLRMADALAAVV